MLFCTIMKRDSRAKFGIARIWCRYAARLAARPRRRARFFTPSARRERVLRQLGACMARKLLYTSRSIRSRPAGVSGTDLGRRRPARVNKIGTAAAFAENVNQENRL